MNNTLNYKCSHTYIHIENLKNRKRSNRKDGREREGEREKERKRREKAERG